MVAVFSWFPARIGRVAVLAICREFKGGMVWIGGVVVIRLVTGDADRRCSRVIGCFMTRGTTNPFVTQGKRKEIMVNACTRPGKCIHIVTIGAVGGKVTGFVIGIFSQTVIIVMTINALNSERPP
jgi:hypothetical protein